MFHERRKDKCDTVLKRVVSNELIDVKNDNSVKCKQIEVAQTEI